MQRSDEHRASSRSPRWAIALVTILAIVFVAGIVAAPLLESSGHAAGDWLRFAYSPTCHQMPERSLSVAEQPMAVCARCSGLYLGGLIGLLAALPWIQRIRPRLTRWLFFAAVVPTLIDALLPWIGLPGLSNVPRLVLAVPAGLVAGLFLAAGIVDLVTRDRSQTAGRATPTNEPLEVSDG